MLELILVRHGETDSNVKGTYCGWTDTPLNKRGEIQAAEASEKLSGFHFDAVYSSPLCRAVRTAEIITRGMQDIILEASLKEHNFGIWEDMTRGEILGKYPMEAAAWEKDWLNYAVEGGESPKQCCERVSGFIDMLVSHHKDGRVLIVTHHGIIKYAIIKLLDLPIDCIWRFRADNGSITNVVINEDGFAWLNKLNS